MDISSGSRLAGAAVVVGFLSVVACGQYAIHELKVGGPIYDRIVQGKDIVADVLPPPEYIVEAYLESTLALDDPSPLPSRSAASAWSNSIRTMLKDTTTGSRRTFRRLCATC